jgi:hypothetical protein
MLGVEAFFLHIRLVLKLVPQSTISLETVERAEGFERTLAIHRIEQELARAFRKHPPPDLSAHWLKNRAAPRQGEIVSLDQMITVSGVAKALKGESTETRKRATFRGKLLADETVTFGGDFSVEHLTSTSSPEFLIGNRSLFVVAYVTETVDSIGLRPILIGRRLFHLGDQQRHMQDDRFELHPSEVDAFHPAFAVPVALTVRPTKADLDPLRTISERTIKEAFARIIGEPDIPND